MNYLNIFITYIPYIIKYIKFVKAMHDRGFQQEEIKNALNKIDQALDLTLDSDANAELKQSWMHDVEGKNPEQGSIDKP